MLQSALLAGSSRQRVIYLFTFGHQMRINHNKIISLAVLLSLSLAVCSCAPRGETQTLSDILSQQRDRYRSAELKAKDVPVKAQLDQISQKLASIETVQDPNAIKPATGELRAAIAELLPHAGYTVRPGMTEIMNQYGALANGSQVTTDPALAGSPEIRLLLARTYSILASELETGKFSL